VRILLAMRRWLRRSASSDSRCDTRIRSEISLSVNPSTRSVTYVTIFDQGVTASLAGGRILSAHENHMLLYLLCRWFRHRGGPNVLGIDYKFFAEQKKAQDARIKQEQRGDVIDRLLNQANEQGEKTEVEATPVKEVAPAK
jgi:hypothetical protein